MLVIGTGIGDALPMPTTSQIADRLRQSETIPDSLTGTEVVTIDHLGQTFSLNGVKSDAPYLSNAAVAGLSPEGTYRWYVHGRDWWMVKDVHVPSTPGKMPGTAKYVIRSFKDQVLSNDDFQSDLGGHHFLSAHLDRTEYRASKGPAVGRRWTKGSIADMLVRMTDVKQWESPSGIEIDGSFEGLPMHLTVAPRYGYLTTSLLQRQGLSRFGYTIAKVKQIGGTWMPQEVELYNGQYEQGHLVRGSNGHIKFSDFAPHGIPTSEEVPPIPPGSLLGSEDNRLYRVAQDGTLVDFGRQGYKPGTSLAYGDLFVLSGAGLLLTSLSWIVFRKRRSPLSPPGERGRG